MTSTRTANYGHLIRQVLGEQSPAETIDADDVARRVVNLMDPEDQRVALLELLGQQVKYEVASRRRNAIDTLNGSQSLTESHTSSAPIISTPIRQPISRRQHNVRSYWRKLMQEKATNAHGQMISIGSMTRSDLEYNIKTREQLAQRNLDRADQFRRLVALLDKYGVETCEEIPEQSVL